MGGWWFVWVGVGVVGCGYGCGCGYGRVWVGVYVLVSGYVGGWVGRWVGGRWILPKSKLTHNQLSQLLLVYIGTAADIVEFFDAFKEEEVRKLKCMRVCVCVCVGGMGVGVWRYSRIR